MLKKDKESVLINEKLAFIAELSRTSAWIANRYTEFLKPYGISTQQFNILRVLRQHSDWLETLKINDLMIVRSPNITRLIDKLIKKDMAIRERSSEDRRVVLVRITELGLRLLKEIDEQHEGELSDYMDSFTVEEAISSTQILQNIRK